MTNSSFLVVLFITFGLMACEQGMEGGQIVMPMEVSSLSPKPVSYQVQQQYWVFSDSLKQGDTIRAKKLGLLLTSELSQIEIAMQEQLPATAGGFFSPAYAVNLVYDFTSVVTDLKIYSRQPFEGLEAGEPLNELFHISWHSPNVKDDYYLGLRYTLNEFLESKPKPKQQLLFSLKETVSKHSRQEFYVVYQDSGHPEPLHANFPDLVLKP